MKASNIFQTLKSRGYSTDGMKPTLPGLGSPLKKAAPTKYTDDPPKTKPKEVPHESITFDPGPPPKTIRIFSDANVKKYGIKKKIVSKAEIMPSATSKKKSSPASMKSPAKKKSCGSPVKMDTEAAAPSEAMETTGYNPKRAIRQARRRARRGGRQAMKDFRKCKRSRYGRGKA